MTVQPMKPADEEQEPGVLEHCVWALLLITVWLASPLVIIWAVNGHSIWGRVLFACVGVGALCSLLLIGACMASGKKTNCPKCLGFKTIQLTDGSLRVCPKCNGEGTVEE